MFVTAKTRLHSRLNSIVMLLLLSIVLGLLAWLSNKHAVEYDWSTNGRHTLSEASRELLMTMPDPIVVTSYARENLVLRNAVKELIEKYQKHKANIELNFVNPDSVPDKIRELGISIPGEIIVHYQGRSEHVRSDQEQIFTNALLRLARNQERWIAFVEGHGERSSLNTANYGLSTWVKQLSSQGYRSQPINLAETTSIPDNTSILIIAGPHIDYLPSELKVILDYINAGGNLLWLHDPGSLYKLETLAEELSIRFYPGVIIDIDYEGLLVGIDNPTIALVTRSLYSPHAVTEGFDFTTIFPMSSAIEILASDKWRSKPLLNTSEHSWSETGKIEGSVAFNKDSDTQGPLTIGVSLEREIEVEKDNELITKQQRIIVMGDGDFLSNTYLANGGNNELGTRMINWLSSDDEFITVPPKIANDTQLNISPAILGLMGIVLLFFLPAALIAIGITIGLRRKKQ